MGALPRPGRSPPDKCPVSWISEQARTSAPSAANAPQAAARFRKLPFSTIRCRKALAGNRKFAFFRPCYHPLSRRGAFAPPSDFLYSHPPRRTGNHPYKCPAPGFSTFCRWAALLRPDARTVTTRFPVPWEPGNSAAPGSFSCPGASSPPPAGRPRADAPALSPASPPAWRPAPPYGGRSAAASPSGTGGFPRSGEFYRRNLSSRRRGLRCPAAASAASQLPNRRAI